MPVSKALKSCWASCVVNPDCQQLFNWGYSYPLFIGAVLWISSIFLLFLLSVLLVLFLFSMVGNMKKTFLFLMLLLPSVAFSATWSVKPSEFTKRSGLSEVVNIEQSSISARILAVYKATGAANETYTDSGCTFTANIIGTCTIAVGTKLADGSTSSYNVRITVVPGTAAVACDPTVELKGKTSPIIESGGKAYVSWSVSQVTPENLCHNSCVYYASSANVSTCYRTSSGATDGWCNFFVAVNSAAGSCTTSSGYAVGSTGAELNASAPVDPGGDTGGGEDGGDTGGTDPGTGGGTGGGNSGGTTVVSGTVDLEFKDPGNLSSQLGHYLGDDGSVSGAAGQLPGDLSKQFDDSNVGKSVEHAVSSFTDMANAPATCPTGQIQLFEQTIIIDGHCRLFAEIQPILELASRAGWMLLAAFIIFSA